MKQKVSPIVAVVLVVLALVGVGALGMKLMAGSGVGEAKAQIVKPDNPNDPKYKADPRLAGGGGG